MTNRLWLAPVLALGVTAVGSQQNVKFTRAFALAPTEGVFAYSRISPDGDYLAYASQAINTARPGRSSSENLYGPTGIVTSQMVTVVDLNKERVLFTDRGLDAYWSLDGERMIYSGEESVNIWHRSGQVSRGVAPGTLGDYYSWAVRDGKDLILTISNNYYYLHGDFGCFLLNRLLSLNGISLPMISLTPTGLAMTEGRNQMPTTLLFYGDQLIDRRLGAQTFDELKEWALSAGATPRQRRWSLLALEEQWRICSEVCEFS